MSFVGSSFKPPKLPNERERHTRMAKGVRQQGDGKDVGRTEGGRKDKQGKVN